MNFYKPIAAHYEEIFPLKEPTVSFVRSFLEKEPSKILDIGCAVGQLAMALAAQGHEAAGIDLDEDMIRKARKKASDQGVKSDFSVMDMMAVDKHFRSNSFDMVLCLGNTMVHLQSLEEMQIFITKVFRLLKENGVFIVQVVNYDAVLGSGVKELPVIDTGHVRFERGYRYDKDDHKIRFCSRLTVKKDKEIFENEILLYPLTREEMGLLMDRAGFHQVEYFGNFGKDLHRINSPALIVVSRSKAGI